MTLRCPECGSDMVVALVEAELEMDMRQWGVEQFLYSLQWSTTSFDSHDIAGTMVRGKFRAFACHDCEHVSRRGHSKAQHRALVEEWSEKED